MGMDDSVRRRAVHEIRRILETAGYDIEEEGEPFDFSALAGRECILTLCTNDPAIARRFDHTQYNLDDDGEKIPCKKLIFSNNPEIHPEEGVLWQNRDLARYAGEAAVARVSGERLTISWKKAPGREGVKPHHAGHAPPPGRIRALPIRVTADEAMRISGQNNPARLRLIPIWVYDYACKGDASYKGKHITFDANGTGAISAVNGLPQDLESEAISEIAIPDDAEMVRPSILQKEAEEKILAHLIGALSKRVRIKTESGDAIFSEEKTFRPPRDQIERTIQLTYIPIWQIRGKHIVEVNAFTGEILSEPMDEGVELL